ncbi:hypothetical protein [Chamaesiphon sp. VAR_48_metabat_135_sub]|uniref:hypothetical protein n=1 Tax=Chamaesiphon sp. VAR_48_metabat_135_sub TaxID=2964699 RepID=UPI00286D2AC7|nr:hypothetical protein [Chamaesiphon sp. VAR_48_metabat_135_sub]
MLIHLIVGDAASRRYAKAGKIGKAIYSRVIVEVTNRIGSSLMSLEKAMLPSSRRANADMSRR